MRALQEDPWAKHVENLRVGQLIEGEITRITNFGAFVKLNLPGDLEGLVHISEVSDRQIESAKEVIKSGDIRTLRIIKIEPEEHRIGLSLRKVDHASYAEADWKALRDSLNSEGSDEGETLGDFVSADLAEEISQSVTEETSVEEVSVEEAPVEETPVEEVPVEEVPAEETPTEETPAEDAE
jgi:predicted RNA-binding protein with RPS1 domain